MNNTSTVNRSELPQGSSGVSLAQKVFSYPVSLGAVLLAGTFAGRYLSIYESAPHSSSFSNIPFEGDTWWHVVVGNYILSTGHWPTRDMYSFTAHGAPWIAYEWLGEVTMAVASRFAGVEGLTWLLLLMSGSFVLLIYYHSYQRCGNSTSAFLACAALLPLASFYFTLRPQMLGYAFLTTELIILERFRSGDNKALWFLPGIFLIWANTHGTFFFGFLMVVIYWAAGLLSFHSRYFSAVSWSPKQRQQLEVTFLLCLLTSIVTPYGDHLLGYFVQISTRQAEIAGTNSEWFSIRANTFEGVVFFALLIIFIVHLLLDRPRYRLEEVAVFLFGVYETLLHIRFLTLFVITSVPLLAGILNRWMPKGKKNGDLRAVNAAVVCLALIMCIESFPSKKEVERAIANNFPVGAVAYLSHYPIPGNMLNQITWGGYLTYPPGGEHRVFIDGREDLYQYANVLHDYLTLIGGDRHAFFLLRKYDVGACLLSPDSGLASLLASSRDWREA